jgi:L-fuculose-phosphate aldolase
MTEPDPREELVGYGRRLIDDGLAIGSAGNLSVRSGAKILITPSAMPYWELLPAQIVAVDAATGAAAVGGPEPSSELPMHLAVYAATGAQAIVHTHSPEVIALSATCDELPAVHYAIAALGGPVRVAPYARFGSAELAAGAAASLAGRRAAILANHGAVACGMTLAEAYERALLLEWLARVFRLTQAYAAQPASQAVRPAPRILTEAELAEVAAEARRRGYRAAYGGDD